MLFLAKSLRTMVLEVPNQGKLAYSLLRDSRVPLPPKLGLIGALGLIVSPLDLPAWIPLVGELDMLALGLLAVKIFIRACPKELVEEHRIALARKEGLFHDDLQAACSGISQRGKNWLGRILPLGGKSRG